MSIEGQGHFFTIYFPGFVCFVLYLAKISGERLQDHWSSGLSCPFKKPTEHLINGNFTNSEKSKYLVSANKMFYFSPFSANIGILKHMDVLNSKKAFYMVSLTVYSFSIFV